MARWCSGLTCCPVKAEITGSNPVRAAKRDKMNKQEKILQMYATIQRRRILENRSKNAVHSGVIKQLGKEQTILQGT